MNLYDALKVIGDGYTYIYVNLEFENCLGVTPDISMKAFDLEYLSQDTLAMKVSKIAARNGIICVCVKTEED